ncbi:MAG: lipopolysaccharide biosynthesis protein [Aureibaculum sp.]|nr:lipopolysaccharide biosynthesis protein [Aureibaculum sp.]
MTLQKLAFKGAMWLALFKLVSQLFSWTITVLVARILSPSDYGLMEMATIITGYAAFFVNLGLGAAIIQKKNINKHELSSIFWFVLAISITISFACYLSAHYMALIFNEPRIQPLVEIISLIFPISGLLIVPSSLLNKNMEFKAIGIIGMVSTITSCTGMYLIALNGGGVWTLVGGMYIQSITRLVASYLKVKWYPLFYFNYQQAKSYIHFGANVLAGRTFFYTFEKSDKFFAGRAWSSQSLGYYGFALQLAQIPTEKITTLINQVSYPVFSKLQDDKVEFSKFYLNVVKVTAIMVTPVFVGGYMLGEDIIKLLLNEKWYPIIYIFKLLCITQIITSLNAVNSFVHYAQGRPNWSLYFHAILAVGMGVSFYYAVPYGMSYIVIPWFTTYLLICGIWTIVTIRKIDIEIRMYVKNIISPFTGALVMVIGLILLENLLYEIPVDGNAWQALALSLKIFVGGSLYVSYLWLFDREIFVKIKELRSA